MAADAFAQTMVSALQAAMAQGPNVLTIQVDGQSVTYQTAADMRAAYDYWTSRVARANGSRPRSAQIFLGGYR